MIQQSDGGEFKGRFPDSWILRTDERSWHGHGSVSAGPAPRSCGRRS
jgi:hypothetical protein